MPEWDDTKSQTQSAVPRFLMNDIHKQSGLTDSLLLLYTPFSVIRSTLYR
jgi:hypothetical protein